MASEFTITRDSYELSVLTHPQIKETMFCEACQADVRWVLPEEAMVLARTGLRELFRMIEARGVHFSEDAEGFLLVCVDSLTNRMEKMK